MIELITVIVIMSIISAMAGMGLVQLASGYYLAKTSTVAAQQAQIALSRLTKEFSKIQSIATTTSSPTVSIVYTRYTNIEGSGNPVETHTLSWAGIDQPLTLDGDTLIDKVQSFSLTYYNYNYSTWAFSASAYSLATAVIEITIQLKGYRDASIIFTERVAI